MKRNQKLVEEKCRKSENDIDESNFHSAVSRLPDVGKIIVSYFQK